MVLYYTSSRSIEFFYNFLFVFPQHFTINVNKNVLNIDNIYCEDNLFISPKYSFFSYLFVKSW